MYDVKCPYCGSEQYICHDDGQGYEEGEYHNQQCSDCEKYFVYTTSISYYYEAEEADCLNGGKYSFRPTTTYPKEFTRMECIQCGEVRQPNDEEWKSILAE